MRISQIWRRPWAWVLLVASIPAPLLLIAALYRCPFYDDIIAASRRSHAAWFKSAPRDASVLAATLDNDASGHGMTRLLTDLASGNLDWTAPGAAPLLDCVEGALLPQLQRIADASEGSRASSLNILYIAASELCRRFAPAHALAGRWDEACDRLTLGARCVDCLRLTWIPAVLLRAHVERANLYAQCGLMLGLNPGTTGTLRLAATIRQVRTTEPRWNPETLAGMLPEFAGLVMDPTSGELQQQRQLPGISLSGWALLPLLDACLDGLAGEAYLVHPDPARRAWCEGRRRPGFTETGGITPWYYRLQIKRARWLLEGAPNMLPNVLARQGVFKGLDPLAIAFYVNHPNNGFLSPYSGKPLEMHGFLSSQGWLMEAACGARLFRLEHGRWPQSIRELSPYLPGLPEGFVDPARMPAVNNIIEATSAPLGTMRMGMVEMTRERMLSYLPLQNRSGLAEKVTGGTPQGPGMLEGMPQAEAAGLFQQVASTSGTRTFRLTYRDHTLDAMPLVADEIERLGPDLRTSATVTGLQDYQPVHGIFNASITFTAVERTALRRAMAAVMARRVSELMATNGLTSCTLPAGQSAAMPAYAPFTTTIDITVPSHVFAVWIDGFVPAEPASWKWGAPESLHDYVRQQAYIMMAITSRQLIVYPGR